MLPGYDGPYTKTIIRSHHPGCRPDRPTKTPRPLPPATALDTTLEQLQICSGRHFHLDAVPAITIAIEGHPELTLENVSITVSMCSIATQIAEKLRFPPQHHHKRDNKCNHLAMFYHPDDPTRTLYSCTSTVAGLGVGPAITFGMDLAGGSTHTCSCHHY